MPNWPPGWTEQDEEDYLEARAEAGGRIASRAQVMANRKAGEARRDDWQTWFRSLPEGTQLHYNNGGDQWKAAVKVTVAGEERRAREGSRGKTEPLPTEDAMETVALIGNGWREYDLRAHRENPYYPRHKPTQFGGRGTIFEHPSYSSQYGSPESQPIRLVMRHIAPLTIADIEAVRKAWPAEWMKLLAFATLPELERRAARAREGLPVDDAPGLDAKIESDRYHARLEAEKTPLEVRATDLKPGMLLSEKSGALLEVGSIRRVGEKTVEIQFRGDLAGRPKARVRADRVLKVYGGAAPVPPPPRGQGSLFDLPDATALFAVNDDGLRMPVSSLEDAQQKWNAYRDASSAGVSEIGNGVRVESKDGKVVGRISYNGRIWKGDEIPGGPPAPIKRADNPGKTAGDGSVYLFRDPDGSVIAEGFVQGAHGALLIGMDGLKRLREATDQASRGERLKVAEPIKGHVLLFPKGTDWTIPFAKRPTLNVPVAGKAVSLDPAELGKKNEGRAFTARELSSEAGARAFLTRKISELRREGYPRSQAVAIAFDEARALGFSQVPPSRSAVAIALIGGDRARYTGKTQRLNGGLFYEVEMLEGHLKGQTKVTQRPPAGEPLPLRERTLAGTARVFDGSTIVHTLQIIRERGRRRGAVPLSELVQEMRAQGAAMSWNGLKDLLLSMSRAALPQIDLQIAHDPAALPESQRRYLIDSPSGGGKIAYVSLVRNRS